MANGNRMKRWASLSLAAALVAAIGVHTLGGAATAEADGARTDLVRISPADGAGQMPSVTFQHDRHTEALKGQSCDVCHLSDEGRTVFRFKRLQDAPPSALKDLYHEACIGCHRQTVLKGARSGPQEADCRVCHRQEAPVSARVAFGLDKSLHQRHKQAELIRPTTAGDTAN